MQSTDRLGPVLEATIDGNYLLKDNFQEILVAIFVQRRLSAMISPFILKKKNHIHFFRISH